MREKIIAITGGTIVLPDRAIQGSILVQNGRIKAITPAEQTDQIQADYQVIDAQGMYVVPGMIDIHSDAIEKEIEPRPGSYFPMDMAFYELERKLVGHGITTMYHGLSLSGGVGVRSDEIVEQALQEFYRLSQMRSLIRHRLHLRYEVINFPAVDMVRKHISDGSIHLFSFMDHSPGQGQYSAPGSYTTYVSKTHGLQNEEARAMARLMVEKHAQVDWQKLKELAVSARAAGIPLASHDDDSKEKVDQNLLRSLSIGHARLCISSDQ
ncbi:hypothetical protein KDH_04490 [Dictyobacter sp. S3.2.2.5]|uniref:Amidohydrolase 3 domain-containing protein n=1 Tax=Dictyobacter halimunensis TaxID=3026934 RepID=A0ABQ6FK57_9CHLR|nr:hypothetical protein KDH_04490 [Dictyobacter sp. S3.2.2.5]